MQIFDASADAGRITHKIQMLAMGYLVGGFEAPNGEIYNI